MATARDLMTHCERRTQYKVNGKYDWRWKEVPASEAVGTAPKDLRCMHCQGPVKLLQKKTDDGVLDHVEHKLKADSEGCCGGHHFKGTHKLAAKPVV